jgi:flagellar biosynthetic protein FlhB
MSDPQRTQKATPKRVKEFRKRGEIALSRDAVSTATLAGGVIALVACSSMALSALLDLTRDAALATDGAPTIDLPRTALHAFLRATAPALVGAAGAAIVAVLAQLGWPPAFKKPSFDLSRISPLHNLKQTFALGAVARRSGAAIAKMVVVGAVVVLALRNGIAMHAMQASSIAAVAGGLVGKALLFVLGALAALAAFDYFLARRRIQGQMRMTPDEVKREMREQEGDPHVKGRRRQKMRELAKRRIAIAVAKADVVVVNPTHYAVALRYDDATDRAPVVVAKGVDELAEKIREVARTHSVPVLSRPPLARALHKSVKEGRPVPANLYRAVAEVLAYVYRLRRTG